MQAALDFLHSKSTTEDGFSWIGYPELNQLPADVDAHLRREGEEGEEAAGALRKLVEGLIVRLGVEPIDVASEAAAEGGDDDTGMAEVGACAAMPLSSERCPPPSRPRPPHHPGGIPRGASRRPAARTRACSKTGLSRPGECPSGGT